MTAKTGLERGTHRTWDSWAGAVACFREDRDSDISMALELCHSEMRRGKKFGDREKEQ